MDTLNLLTVKNLSKSFGGLTAVQHVNFELPKGQVRAIIGPNGAGKTTFVSLVSGRLSPSQGSIYFNAKDITRMPAWQRVRLGIAYTFQITSIYQKLSVFENVAIALQNRVGESARESLEVSVHDCLAKVGLLENVASIAGELAYGHQRLLEIAMGLALRPALLILDEPTQGLSDSEIETFCELVREIKREATILLIEHNMSVVMALADRITVLDRGAVLAEGSAQEIEANSDVQSAYLGT
jgi:branched-chain amino acid transport system ATP-binding protein